MANYFGLSVFPVQRNEALQIVESIYPTFRNVALFKVGRIWRMHVHRDRKRKWPRNSSFFPTSRSTLLLHMSSGLQTLAQSLAQYLRSCS